MDTKSRNKDGLVLSVIAIVLAIGSMIYCASFVGDLFMNGLERLSLATNYFERIIRGGTVG